MTSIYEICNILLQQAEKYEIETNSDKQSVQRLLRKTDSKIEDLEDNLKDAIDTEKLNNEYIAQIKQMLTTNTVNIERGNRRIKRLEDKIMILQTKKSQILADINQLKIQQQEIEKRTYSLDNINKLELSIKANIKILNDMIKNEEKWYEYFKDSAKGNNYVKFNVAKSYNESKIPSPDTLKKIFKNNVDLGVQMNLNTSIPDMRKQYNYVIMGKNITRSHSDIYLRIMTWNVRYWTNIDDLPRIMECSDVIKTISPDIVCLQESTVGYSKYYPKNVHNKPIDIRQYLDDYELISFCNVVPSWYSTHYGNMILVHKRLEENLRQQYGALHQILCNIDRCTYNQYAKTYSLPTPKTRSILGSNVAVFKQETRCFIKIAMPDFDIICTHLEAYDKLIRRKQLDELKEYITRKTIIVGDFNIMNSKNYAILLNDEIKLRTSEEENKKIKEIIANEFAMIKKINNENDQDYEYSNFEELNWKNCFEYAYVKYTQDTRKKLDDIIKANIKNNDERKKFIEALISFCKQIMNYEFTNLFAPNMSVWNNTVVDYIFFSKHWDEPHFASKMFDDKTGYDEIHPYTYFTDVSDHLPIIVDIGKYNMGFNVEPTLGSEGPGAQLYSKLNPDELKVLSGWTFYNGQPLSAYDWYNDTGTINVDKYTFMDPYMTGNFTLTFGSNGVYYAYDTKGALYYGSDFQNRMINSDALLYSKTNTGLERCALIFEFFIKNKIETVEGVTVTAQVLPPEILKKLDTEVDIIENKYYQLGKFTPRQYNATTGSHAVIGLKTLKLFIILPQKVAEIRSEQINLLDSTDQNMLESVNTKLNEIIKAASLTDYNSDDITKFSKIFLNSIWYMNQKNIGKTHSKFIDLNSTNISEHMKKITYQNHYITYTIYDNMLPREQAGGIINFKKYKETKNNYIKLNRM
jgi:endonuclease/exonuclease/phosphatase family metal-dependent hydrolase